MIVWAVFGQEIHLKTRTIRPDPLAAAISPGPPGSYQPGEHQIVQFDHSPSLEDLEGLLSEGHPVVSVLPDNAVMVTAHDRGVEARPGIQWIGQLDPADKLSPELSDRDYVTALIEFHGDVSPGDQDTVAAQEGVTLLRPRILAGNHAIAVVPMDALRALAAHDEVAYIFPADPALLIDDAFNACAGMLTVAGPMAQFANIVHGWSFDADHAVHLGYFFGSITPKVPAATVESEVVRALNEWSKYTNVIFQPAAAGTSLRTVSVKFTSGAHGDSFPFDGPGGVLAHTFYPVPVNPEPIAGDMHLDADENWHAGGDLDIYSVALHEAGHAIGLSHSDKPGDAMYPYYRSGLHLSANDVGAAQALYGAPVPAAITAIAAPVSSGPAPLLIGVDAVPSTTDKTQITLSGTFSGGVAPVSIQWQTDEGYAGKASSSGSGWISAAIPLVNGFNSISVSAFDAAHQSSTKTENITLTPASSSVSSGSPVSIQLTTPASQIVTVSAASLALGGTAAGGSGISRVTWQSSGGAAGTATGTSHWMVTAVPLLTGTNTVVVRAYDARGVSAWASVIAVRH